MDKIEKFLAKLDRKRRERVSAVLRLIGQNAMQGLDIKPLRGQKGHFRCRLGNIRILFCTFDSINLVYNVDFRGNVYRKQ